MRHFQQIACNENGSSGDWRLVLPSVCLAAEHDQAGAKGIADAPPPNGIGSCVPTPNAEPARIKSRAQ